LQTILLTKQIYLPLLLSVILPVVLTLIFGRVFCSWMCPQNTLSEWLDALHKRFWKSHWLRAHRRPIEKNPSPMLYWSLFAALVLAALLFALPMLSYLSLPGIISSSISQSILGMGFGIEIALVLLILISELLLARRYWCKYACPVGAMLAVFRCKYTMHLVYDESQCACHLQTEPCHYVCPLQLSPKRENVYPYCFNCGLCTAVCEKTGRAALTFGKLLTKKRTSRAQ
ncbi:4Fe-4S binding protein, partial [candidate division KSB1 bacterium]|nr:4Fe-4S binding protein [candidate division KSB1 bacterium]